MNVLQGKVALITGGSSGIDLATAREFHAQGAKVVLSGRDREKLAGVASELGQDVLAVRADITNPGDIDELMARAKATELIDRGIRVNTITIGPTDTPILHRSEYPPEVIAALKQSVVELSPLKRLGRPEGVAKVALFLASSDSSSIVGSEIAANGGLTANLKSFPHPTIN